MNPCMMSRQGREFLQHQGWPLVLGVRYMLDKGIKYNYFLLLQEGYMYSLTVVHATNTHTGIIIFVVLYTHNYRNISGIFSIVSYPMYP